MAVSSSASGSQLAVIGTEHTLSTITTAGVYLLVVDTNAMVNGDELELRAKTKAKTGSSSREAFYQCYSHIQGQPNKYSIPVPIDVEVLFTLKQTAGTGRTFDWNVLSL